MAGNSVDGYGNLPENDQPRPAGLIQRSREELQVRRFLRCCFCTASCWSGIWRRVGDRQSCRMRWRRNIGALSGNGVGKGSFARGIAGKTTPVKKEGHHHLDPSVVQKAVKQAAKRAGLTKPAGCHTFRHPFTTHLLERGQEIRTIQELMGHSDRNTTMIYTLVLKRGAMGIISPADLL